MKTSFTESPLSHRGRPAVSFEGSSRYKEATIVLNTRGSLHSLTLSYTETWPERGALVTSAPATCLLALPDNSRQLSTSGPLHMPCLVSGILFPQLSLWGFLSLSTGLCSNVTTLGKACWSLSPSTDIPYLPYLLCFHLAGIAILYV